MSLIFVALGAILLWFLIVPFLKAAPTASPEEDPRLTCSVCDELRDPGTVIEREFGAGRYHHICGDCLRTMVDDYQAAHGALPDTAVPSPADHASHG